MRKNVTKKQLAAYESTDLSVSAYTIGGAVVGGLIGYLARQNLCQSSTSAWCVGATSGQPSNLAIAAGAVGGGILGYALLYATAK